MGKSSKFWDWISKNYDRNAMDSTYELILKKTPKYLQKDDKLLDFACATGLYSVEFSNAVREIEALDISPKMIDLAEQKAKTNKINNITFSCSSIFDDKYQKGNYDVILALNILLYFNDIEGLLTRLDHLLKPGGLIVTSTACLKEKRSIASIFSTPIIWVLSRLRLLPYLRFLKMRELEQSISDADFNIVETAILMDSPATEYFIVARKR